MSQKWIMFKKNPMNDRVYYVLPNVESSQSMTYETFYKYVCQAHRINDLSDFIKQLNSHILLKLENGVLTRLNELKEQKGVLESEVFTQFRTPRSELEKFKF